MREKRRGNWFPLPPPFWIREGKNERTRRTTNSFLCLACARFCFWCASCSSAHDREKEERKTSSREKYLIRCDENGNKNVPKAWTRRVRSRPKLYQPRVSQTRTSRRARAPWAFSKSSRRERRKTQSGDALRRTSSLVCWWWYYAVNSRFVLFCTGVFFSPSSVPLSFYNFIQYTNLRRIRRRDKKEQLRSRARDRQTELLAFRWFDDAWINNRVCIQFWGRFSGEIYQFCGKKERKQTLTRN